MSRTSTDIYRIILLNCIHSICWHLLYYLIRIIAPTNYRVIYVLVNLLSQLGVFIGLWMNYLSTSASGSHSNSVYWHVLLLLDLQWRWKLLLHLLLYSLLAWGGKLLLISNGQWLSGAATSIDTMCGLKWVVWGALLMYNWGRVLSVDAVLRLIFTLLVLEAVHLLE